MENRQKEKYDTTISMNEKTTSYTTDTPVEPEMDFSF